MRPATILAALALAACSAGANGGDVVEGPVAHGIEGEYVVAYVNEARPLINIEGSEPTVTIDGTRIHFQSQCIYHNWSYELAGERLTTAEWDYGDELVGMCARANAPGEEAIIAAFAGADVLRRVAFGLWVSGDGGTVQLRRVPSDKELAGRDVDLTGRWMVTALDGRTLPHPLEVTADFEALWWEPGYAGQGRAYAIAGAVFSTLTPDAAPGAVCDIGVPEEVGQLWRALDMADTITSMADGKVRIAGSGHQVVLSPAAGELP